MMNLKAVSLSAVILFGLTAASTAATITFGNANTDPYLEGGFSVTDPRIVSGNCNTGGSGDPCSAFNGPNDQSLLTQVGGGLFNMESFWFQFLGNNGVLAVTGFDALGGIIASLELNVATYGHNDGGQVILTPLFVNVASVLFDNIEQSNIRVDDINAVSAVPLPAALPLLGVGLGGLGVMGWMRRRRGSRSAA